MQKTITGAQPAQRSRALPGTRFRGYRIIAYHGYGLGPAQHLPIIFAPALPAQWEEVKQDASVTQAVMYRSGRKFRTYSRQGKNA